jgi:hypothetical protein
MKTTTRVFAIIGLVFMGIAILGNIEDGEALGYTLLVVAVWLPLCIISLIAKKIE